MPSDEVQRALSTLIEPFVDPEMAKGIRARSCALPPGKLLHAAVAKEPKDRPSPLEFGREFVAAP